MSPEDISLYVTPASLLLLCFILVYKLKRDTNPIFISMIKGLSIQAQSNSMFFAMMTLVAANIFFGASADEARVLGFAKLAAASKVIGLTCGGVLAYLIKNSFAGPEVKTMTETVIKNEITKTTTP